MEVPSREVCREMFEKVTEYLNGELAVTVEEYQLLLRLNQMSLAKYSDMSALARRLNEVSQRLSDKFVSLQPYCDLIDQVEGSVSALEQTAYRLDAYCKRLGGYSCTSTREDAESKNTHVVCAACTCILHDNTRGL